MKKSDYKVVGETKAPQIGTVYKRGSLTLIVSRETKGGFWHLSISHPMRDPKLSEIRDARAALLPTSNWMAILLPPAGIHENEKKYSIHLWEINIPESPEST